MCCRIGSLEKPPSLNPEPPLLSVMGVMRQDRGGTGISRGLSDIDSERAARMVVPCRCPSIRSQATGRRTARTARQERRLRRSYRERWEDEFRPENLNNTLLKVLLGAAFISLLALMFGWKYYFWPMPVMVAYYLIRITRVKIRMRRNQER